MSYLYLYLYLRRDVRTGISIVLAVVEAKR